MINETTTIRGACSAPSHVTNSTNFCNCGGVFEHLANVKHPSEIESIYLCESCDTFISIMKNYEGTVIRWVFDE